MKIGRGDGNAADEQHSAYLLEASHFLTADRALVKVLNEVARQSAFTFATPHLVEYKRGARPIVDAIGDALDSVRTLV